MKRFSLSPPSTASMVVSIIALVAACAGGAYAAAAITGGDVVNGSLTSKDVKDKTLRSKDLSNELIGAIDAAGEAGAQGPAGEAGPQGPVGPAGVKGETGAPGIRGPAGEDGEDGEDGVDGVDGQNAGPTEFGVARLYRNNSAVTSYFSADVPDDGSNAAQVSGVSVSACQGGDAFNIEAVFRSDEADGGQAGATLVITTQSGQLVGAGQTSPSIQFPGTSVVNLGSVPKTSGEPLGADDTELVSVTIPGGVPAGTQCVVTGTSQFFDFDDSNGVEG